MNDSLITLLNSPAVQSILTEYTNWHFIHALCWVLLGKLLVFTGFYFYHKHKTNNSDWFVIHLFTVLVTVFGLLMIVHNLPTIFYPKAITYNQLLINLKKTTP